MVVPYSHVHSGFAVEIPLNATSAAPILQKLKQQVFWDRATREFSVAFAIHNAPGQFTGSIQVKFQISPFGRVSHHLDAQFLRLTPYSERISGGCLFYMQIALTIWVALTFAWYIMDVISQPHIRWCVAKILRFWSLIEISSYIMFISSLVSWFEYMDDPDRMSFDFNSKHYQSTTNQNRQI